MPQPEPRLIRTFEDAEQAAAEWLGFYGFNGVVMTEPGKDRGVDVVGDGIVAQVKAEVGKVGRPVVQQVYGEAAFRGCSAAVFSLGGYTPDALMWADEVGVGLFVFDLSGEPRPVNDAATDMTLTSVVILTAPGGESVTVTVEGVVQLGLLGVFVDQSEPLLVRATATALPRLVP